MKVDMENSGCGMQTHYSPVQTTMNHSKKEDVENSCSGMCDPRQDSDRKWKIVCALCFLFGILLIIIGVVAWALTKKTLDTKPMEIKLANKTQDVQFSENQTKINIPFPSKEFTIDATLILKETAYFDVYIQRNNAKPRHYGHECSELHCPIKMRGRIHWTPDDNVTMTIEPKKSLVSVEKLTVDFTPMRNNTNE